ncbi:MAG: FHA domain-containing protein [Planctomycetes bacterium]|nr:FHA domain-containing protein [Planctomycetota bacterium]
MAASSSIYLVLTNIPHAEFSHKVEEQPKMIGRSPDAAIWIPAHFSQVSRRHAEVWIDKYGIQIRDLGSRHGTCINGVWLDRVKQAAIERGDRIWVGGVEFRIVDDVAALAKFRPQSRDPDETPPPGPHPSPARAMFQMFSAPDVEVLLWISRGKDKESEIAKLRHRTEGRSTNNSTASSRSWACTASARWRAGSGGAIPGTEVLGVGGEVLIRSGNGMPKSDRFFSQTRPSSL